MQRTVLAWCFAALSAVPAAAQAPRDTPPPAVDNARRERELRALVDAGTATRDTYLELARLDTKLLRYADAVAALGSVADLDEGSADAQHRVATMCWQYANRDVQDPAGRLLYIREGVAL